jgi:hypothetical protein
MTAAREENARAEGGSTTGLEGQGLTAAAKVEVGGGALVLLLTHLLHRHEMICHVVVSLARSLFVTSHDDSSLHILNMWH